jgi:hypothetical protein
MCTSKRSASRTMRAWFSSASFTIAMILRRCCRLNYACPDVDGAQLNDVDPLSTSSPSAYSAGRLTCDTALVDCGAPRDDAVDRDNAPRLNSYHVPGNLGDGYLNLGTIAGDYCVLRKASTSSSIACWRAR